MGLSDLIIIPVFIVIFHFLASLWLPFLTNERNQQYYFPALYAKFLGAIALGAVYQFYYGGGGDTYMYYTLGTSKIWAAFLEDPFIAFRIIFGEMVYEGSAYIYQSQIYTYGDAASFFVVRLGGIFSILSANSYGAISMGFAFVSFFGVWKLFLVFSETHPHIRKELAWGILFLPSIFFWGSGLLKDSITLGALGFLIFSLYQLIEKRRNIFMNILIILITVYILQLVKIYIMLALFPAIIIWLYMKVNSNFSNQLLKWMVAPAMILVFFFFGLLASQSFAEDSHRYSFDKVLITAEETAQWNYYVSQIQSGSGYTLGDYDFSPTGLVRKFIPAVLTAIFRPTLIEARNPVMLMSAVENLVILVLFILSVSKGNWRIVLSNRLVVVSIVFVLLFSFATGVTTYNFGALARYRIPMLPFLMFSLFYVYKSKTNHFYTLANEKAKQ